MHLRQAALDAELLEKILGTGSAHLLTELSPYPALSCVQRVKPSLQQRPLVLELTEILLTRFSPPNVWIEGLCHHAWLDTAP